MKPTRRHFLQFKSKLETIKPITIGKVMGYAHPPEGSNLSEALIEEMTALVIDGVELSSSFFDRNFQHIRSEVKSNLSLPILKEIKIEYLTEILDFYLHLDARIDENEEGNIVTDIFKFGDGLGLDSLEYIFKHTYVFFIRNFKDKLRKEISYLNEKLSSLENKNKIEKSSKMKRPDIEWNADLNDLVELVRALKLSGAIRCESRDIQFKEAYKIFGDLFGVEIRNPEDQMREKSETLKKKFFCEKLNKVAQKDIKRFYERSN